MPHITTRAERRQLARDNAKQPSALQEVPERDWPIGQPGLAKVFRSRDFLVQQFHPNEPGAPIRLSIARTSIDTTTGRWHDGITWDDLQRLKRDAGFGDFDGLEVYPRDRDTINVANMRHIFVMTEPVPFAWRK